ncbi:MAG: hypothetical protein NUW23_14955 [Firmicutes bacterium]|jgi:hypothetical protein|nr:hypothetical protein [Bacillota bacterium]
MSHQFIINGIGYDLWPISWERAERIANFDECLVSIVADARVVYYGDDQNLERFNSLKRRIEELMTPEKRPLLLGKAERILGEAKALFFDACLYSSDLERVRLASSDILEEILAALAYANSTYTKKGAARAEDELRRFSVVPDGFMDLFRAVISGNDPQAILRDVRSLIHSVDLVVSDAKGREEPVISDETARGFYEELKSTYNKLYHACDNAEHAKAFFAANHIVREVKGLLGSNYGDHGFPDLCTPLSEGKYQLAKESATEHEARLVAVLKRHGVSINEFSSIDEFRGYGRVFSSR